MMNTRKSCLLAGLMAFAISGAVQAHEPARTVAYAGAPWAGSVAIWGGSQGYSGWSGNIRIGTLPGYLPGYVAVVEPFPAGHRHLASCRHGPSWAYAQAHRKNSKHGRAHGHGHGRDKGRPGRH